MYANGFYNASSVNYRDIPGFPSSSVPGHAARFIMGERDNLPIISMQGRVHYYEGHSQRMATIGVRIMKKLGIEYLIITNAAGGVNTGFAVGDIMLIADHINFSGSHPLIGENMDEFGPRFPDLCDVYSASIRGKIMEQAGKMGLRLREGVYMMFSGPSYETPAEIRMARTMGADAVGMSTVPEAIVAAHCRLKTIGLSLITNMAAGVSKTPLSHAEVQAAGNAAAGRIALLLDRILEGIANMDI
jgi:purine-nucleoside phosphorylase